MKRRRDAVDALVAEFLGHRIGKRLTRAACAYLDLRDAFFVWATRRSQLIRPLDVEFRAALERQGYSVALSNPPGRRFLEVTRRR